MSDKKIKRSLALAEELLSLYNMDPDHVEAPDPFVENIAKIIEQFIPESKDEISDNLLKKGRCCMSDKIGKGFVKTFLALKEFFDEKVEKMIEDNEDLPGKIPTDMLTIIRFDTGKCHVIWPNDRIIRMGLFEELKIIFGKD